MLLWRARARPRPRKIEGANTLFRLLLGVKAPRAPIDWLDFCLHLRPELPFCVWKSPDCWWSLSLLTLFIYHRTVLWQLRVLPHPCCCQPWLLADLSLYPCTWCSWIISSGLLQPWVILALMLSWSQHLQTDHHRLVPTTQNPVGGCEQPKEVSCNPVCSVAHPAPTVIPSITTKWGYKSF